MVAACFRVGTEFFGVRAARRINRKNYPPQYMAAKKIAPVVYTSYIKAPQNATFWGAFCAIPPYIRGFSLKRGVFPPKTGKNRVKNYHKVVKITHTFGNGAQICLKKPRILSQKF